MINGPIFLAFHTELAAGKEKDLKIQAVNRHNACKFTGKIYSGCTNRTWNAIRLGAGE
jgi:hypothetical protein